VIADWLLNLPVVLMAIVVFAGTYLVAWIVYFAVTRLAVNDRAKAFKGVSPGHAAAAWHQFWFFGRLPQAQKWYSTFG
jgi:Na+/H+ antiporter NhaB